jgi:hypothetical protein
LWGADSRVYLNIRDELAHQIEGVYFGDRENDEFKKLYDDGVFYDNDDEEKDEILFRLFPDRNEGPVIRDAQGRPLPNAHVLQNHFNAISANKDNPAKQKSDFVRLMFDYNTDVGQHNSAYDYVIKRTQPDITGTQDRWVPEFAKLSRDMFEDFHKSDSDAIGAIDWCVTDFGVHFIFFSGRVTADFESTVTRDGNKRITAIEFGKISPDMIWREHEGAGSAEYRFFVRYYDSIVTNIFSKRLDEIAAEYIDNFSFNKRALREFLKAYNIKL